MGTFWSRFSAWPIQFSTACDLYFCPPLGTRMKSRGQTISLNLLVEWTSYLGSQRTTLPITAPVPVSTLLPRPHSSQNQYHIILGTQYSVLRPTRHFNISHIPSTSTIPLPPVGIIPIPSAFMQIFFKGASVLFPGPSFLTMVGRWFAILIIVHLVQSFTAQ